MTGKPSVVTILSVVVITLPHYVIDYNGCSRPDLTHTYARSEQTEETEKSQAEGNLKRSVTTPRRACPARLLDTWIYYAYICYTYLAGGNQMQVHNIMYMYVWYKDKEMQHLLSSWSFQIMAHFPKT